MIRWHPTPRARRWLDGSRHAVLALLLAVTAGPYEVGAVPADLAAACPGAAAWLEAHPREQPGRMDLRDADRQFEAPALREELRSRVDEDQAARKALLATPAATGMRERVAALDHRNLAWLKVLIADHGLPTVREVGELGVHWIWLLVQHADDDPRFQAAVEPAFLKSFEAGELPADDLARLVDRILLREGRQQRFGTQFDWLSRKFEPRNAGNPSVIDDNRRKIGLMPLADYACQMNLRLR